MDATQIDQVRRFNRLVTQRIGALTDSYLARGRPLGEARVIFEIGTGTNDLKTLRERLGLDSGYMSRLLRSLERQGLVEVTRAEGDARARTLRLTARGQSEYRHYDRRSDELARSMLSPLDPGRQDRLVAAMAEVERLVRAVAVTVAIEAADSGDARWCIEQYFAELDRRFETGFDAAKGGGLDPAELTPPQGWLVIARLDGRPVGCGALKRLHDAIGEIKRVWTATDVRGMGIAGRIMDRLEALAAEAGFALVRLDTNGTLAEAQAMYRKRGYSEIGRYNDNPYAHHWFEKVLA